MGAVQAGKIKDATVLPITLNYEKVFEAEVLPFEFVEDNY